MIRCNACGAVHPANTVYCDECGNRLSQDRKVTTAIFSDRPQNERPLTVGFSTPDGARHFELVLDTQAFIGRTDDATGARPEVSLDLLAGKSEGVSRRHARLLRQGTRVLIEDLNSLNGTFVRGLRLPANTPYVVEPNDELQFGKILLRIEF